MSETAAIVVDHLAFARSRRVRRDLQRRLQVERRRLRRDGGTTADISLRIEHDPARQCCRLLPLTEFYSQLRLHIIDIEEQEQ